MLICLNICALCLSVRRLLKSLQWCSNVGCNGQIYPVAFHCGEVSSKFSSGVPVYLQVFVGSSSGIPVFTGSISGIQVVFQCTLDHPCYTRFTTAYICSMNRVRWESAIHWFLCCWRVRLLTMKTRYDIRCQIMPNLFQGIVWHKIMVVFSLHTYNMKILKLNFNKCYCL